MELLEYIKEKHTRRLREVFERDFTSWQEMLDTDYKQGNGVSEIYSLEELMDEVAKLYAKQIAKEALEIAFDGVVNYYFEKNDNNPITKEKMQELICSKNNIPELK